MGFWQRFAGVFVSKQSIPQLLEGSTLAGVAQGSTAPTRGIYDLLQAFERIPDLRRVVDKVGEGLSGIELKMYRRDRNGEAVEVPSHPLLALLNNPAPGILTRADWIRLLAAYLDLPGECFLIVERSSQGLPVRLYPVPQTWVTKIPQKPGDPYTISFRGTVRNVAPSDVIWMRVPSLSNPYGRGSGIGSTLGDELDLSEYTAKHLKTFFYNRAIPDFMVHVEGMKEQDAADYEQRLLAKFRGYWNASKTWVTGGKKVSIERFDTTFRNMQLVELRGNNSDLIRETWGVPPEKFGKLENSNRATIEGADLVFTKDVVKPRMTRIVDIFNMWLLPEFPGADGLYLGFDDPVQADKEFARTVMEGKPEAFSLNEFRELAGKAPIASPEFEKAPGYAPLTAPSDEARSVHLLGVDQWGQQRREILVLPRATETKLLGAGDKLKGLVDDAANAVDDEVMVEALGPIMGEQMLEWGVDQLDDLNPEANGDFLEATVDRYLREFSTTRVTGIGDTTRTGIRIELAQGVAEGESIAELKKRVEKVFGQARGYRAEMIARTEVLTASNMATYDAQLGSGVVQRRAWVATRDTRTRTTHVELDGQVRGMLEPFKVGERSAMQPGGFGVASEDINCRCTTVAVIDDPEDDKALVKQHALLESQVTTEKLDEVWRDYVDEVEPWEDDARDATIKAFDEQERAVLDEIDRLG